MYLNRTKRSKFLYLTRKEWAHSWVHGGKVPIQLASHYKRDYRDGIYTPDENTLRHLEGMHENYLRVLVNDQSGGKSQITMNVQHVLVDGKEVGKNVFYHQGRQDGLILSFCNHFSSQTAHKLGKQTCVVIQDVYGLMEQISGQIGVQGEARDCRYTNGIQRNHFLKGINDKWQDEFRLFWNFDIPVDVTIWPDTGYEIIVQSPSKTL